MAFKVQIVNISQNYDNIILTNGLTIEMVKIKYNWILNANVKNCILGEDDYGLVWYSGEWLCGEWEKGTWYSGIWHDGVWKDGKFYSYLIDKAMIISNRFVVLDKANNYSEFRNGIWKNGDFYNGTFGYDSNLNKEASYNDIITINFSTAYWENGRFYDGIFKKSVWFDGVFYAGEMESSYWINGRFYSGTFNFHNPQGPTNWFNGYWYGGDFVEGNWLNGTFDQISTNIKSRFGTAGAVDSYTIWSNGNFINGEFHSGLNLDSSGNTLPSITDGLTHWINGNFYNGKWYGGYFLSGVFHNGEWFSGIFNSTLGEGARYNCIWEYGNWYTGLWVNGVFKNGHFYSGMWLDGLFLSGYLSTGSVESPVEPQELFNDVVLPTVYADSIINITSSGGTFLGKVTNNGGAYILDRGVCWTTSSVNLPINENFGDNYYISDQGTMGEMRILIAGLSYNTRYYLRAYAINVTGISYSNLINFITTDDIIGSPSVVTLDPINIIHDGVQLKGIVNASSTGLISECGFYYSSTHDVPDDTDIFVSGVPFTTISVNYLSEITNELNEGTLYYVRAYALNANGPGYGEVKTFTTKTGSTMTIPTVEFAPAISQNSIPPDISSIWFWNITSNSAKTKGNITDNGNDFVTSYGACYSQSNILPDHNDEIIQVLTGTTGYFYLDLTGLNPNTIYYVRLYAKNSIDYGYSEMHTLTTTNVFTLPTVTMVSVENV